MDNEISQGERIRPRRAGIQVTG